HNSRAFTEGGARRGRIASRRFHAAQRGLTRVSVEPLAAKERWHKWLSLISSSEVTVWIGEGPQRPSRMIVTVGPTMTHIVEVGRSDDAIAHREQPERSMSAMVEQRGSLME